MDQDKPESSSNTSNPGKRTRPLLLQPSPKIARISAYASSTSSGVLKNSKKFGPHSPKRAKVSYNKSDVPPPGTPVPDKYVRKAGPYLLGPKVGPSPVKSIVQCLARKERTDEFYQDYALEEVPNPNGNGYIYTGRVRQRLFLVLDCVSSHQFSEKGSELVNLQQYVTKVKKVPEKEAILIFYDIVRVVANLHKRNIVHRDLKLGNIVLNQRTGRITITNFCLGTHLGSDRDLLKDQRGVRKIMYFKTHSRHGTGMTSVSGPSSVLDQLSSIIASYVIVPNPPEDLQVVPDVPLEEDNKAKSPTGVQSSTEVDRKPFLTIPESNGERTPNASEELGVFCVPLPDFIAVNFSNSTRVNQNSLILQPTSAPVDPSALAALNQPRNITVQRIGRDARPLLPAEIARYQHMFASNPTQRQEPPRRPDAANFVPDSRQERPTSRLQSLAQRIPRLIPPIATTSGQTSADFRVIQWPEPRPRGWDNDYILRLPVLDLSRVNNNRIMNPAPVHTVNSEAVVNNPRPNPIDPSDAD
ncbi:hypothetical protein HF086_004225 [Spodoptera exigua]|uniref:Serine/threonine-protein kinase 40 n=1 Tax=Spodoptera exigua TaxID=7107 RepID=A0A922MW85_SPOEX|nr:hypothetical protein HF086_004225 [Spodoptera exigua]